MTPDVARQIVRLQADSVVQERTDTLADKCTEGELSSDERVNQFIGVLQAKDRMVLALGRDARLDQI